ncbi:MAG TPA: proline racemase family protein [Gaiellales bacterium]
MRARRVITVVGCHAGGEIGNVVTGGVLPPPGATVFEQMQALRRDGDGLRRLLLREPRGSVACHANLIVPSTRPDCAAGFIIMEPTEYPPMSGSNTICTATVLLETGMVAMHEPITEFGIETPAGLIRVYAECKNGCCERVTFGNVPAYVVGLDLPLELPGWGELHVDVAWGGAFFAFVKASDFDLEIVPDQAAQLAELGSRITAAAAAQIPAQHHLRSDLHTITFTTFTAPPRAGGDGRNTTVVSPGRLDRSPCGTATSARLAVLHARGELEVGQTFVHESIISSKFVARIEGLTEMGPARAVRPSISGRAWLTGTQQLGRDRRDPLGAGFAVADTWRGSNPDWTIDVAAAPDDSVLGSRQHLDLAVLSTEAEGQ